jgi:hypothetical protein
MLRGVSNNVGLGMASSSNDHFTGLCRHSRPEVPTRLACRDNTDLVARSIPKDTSAHGHSATRTSRNLSLQLGRPARSPRVRLGEIGCGVCGNKTRMNRRKIARPTASLLSL